MASATGSEPWWEKDVTPGLILVAATLISFFLYNGPLLHDFEALMHQPVAARVGDVVDGRTTLHHFINDGLMAIFFVYVGLELKRECIEGPFRNPREAALPIIAAVGGMAIPALIYLAVAAPFDASFTRGWAIPAATDIAFALGVLSLLGDRCPKGLRLFLLALAIIDDLGAILVIALFYSSGITAWALGGAVLTFLAMLGLNRAGVKRLMVFWLLALVLWGFMLASGVHATIAGVLTAMTIPMRRANGASPLEAAEHELKPWVTLGIMPIFAIANAGVHLHDGWVAQLAHPVALACALGLLLGKPVGIAGACFLSARFLKFKLPGPPIKMIGLAMVAGIGFTMSLFIGGLAFGQGDLAAPMRLGVLGGSVLSGALGLWVLSSAIKKSEREAAASSTLIQQEKVAEEKGII